MIQIESNALTTLAGERATFVEEMSRERDELNTSHKEIQIQIKNSLIAKEKIDGLYRVGSEDLNVLESKIEALEVVHRGLQSKEGEINGKILDLEIEYQKSLKEYENKKREVEQRESLLRVEESLLTSSIEKILEKTKKAELKLESLSITLAETRELVSIERSTLMKAVELNKLEAIKNIRAIEAIAGREEAITRKERNFLIMKLRFQKAFEKQYPGQNLDNLI